MDRLQAELAAAKSKCENLEKELKAFTSTGKDLDGLRKQYSEAVEIISEKQKRIAELEAALKKVCSYSYITYTNLVAEAEEGRNAALQQKDELSAALDKKKAEHAVRFLGQLDYYFPHQLN